MFSTRRPAPFVLLALVLITLLCPPPASAREARFSLGLGFDYTTGDYGTEETSDFWSIPLILDYYPTERLDFELILPFISQGSSTTIFSGGQRIAIDRTRGGGGMTGREPLAGEVENSQSGLGDISLTGGYAVITEGARTPRTRAFLYVKFPTASEEDGLGTGAFDVGPGLEVSKWFDRWYAGASASYIFQGSSEDFGLKDYPTFGVEVGNQVAEEVFLSASLWGAASPSEEASSLLEGRANGTFWFSREWSVEGYLAKGLSEDSPDFGAGVALFRHF